MKSKRPPPVPALPPPPPRRQADRRHSGFEPTGGSRTGARFNSEPPTKQKNVTASVYQSLLSVFDEMTAVQRMEFVEFAARYSSLDGRAREALVELLPTYSVLSDSDREAVYELASQLATLSSNQPPRR